MSTFGGEKVHGVSSTLPDTKKNKNNDWAEAGGWLLAILVPLSLLMFGGEWGIDREVSMFLAIFSAAIVMWVFELVDAFIPGLFAVLLTLSLGLAPANVILGGSASDGFFMAMSIFGLGTVLVLSGLSFRCLLWLLRYMPCTKLGHNMGLMFTGILITPLIPSADARTVLISPFLVDMVETLKFQMRGKAATQLAIAAFTGATLISAAFLTSRSINFVIFGLLSPQAQQHFSWAYWIFASAVACGAILLIYAVVVSIIFRSPEKPKLSMNLVEAQLQLLGKLTKRELAVIWGMVIFSLGIFTTSIHNIKPPWIGMAILFFLLLFGFLDRKEFREKTDWPGLIYLGSLVGIIGTFNYLGLDKWMTAHLSVFGDVLRSSFYLFVAVLFLLVSVIRLAIPSSATIAICATIFMPIASQAGISPWVIGFILLLFGDIWFFPFQCPQYQKFQALVLEKGIYNESTFLKFNLFMNLVRLAGVYATIPFWSAIGLL